METVYAQDIVDTVENRIEVQESNYASLKVITEGKGTVAINGQTLTGGDVSVKAGESVRVKVNPAEGYELDKVEVNGVVLTKDNAPSAMESLANGYFDYTFWGDQANSIKVTFAKVEAKETVINVTTEGKGTVVLNNQELTGGDVLVKTGEEVRVTVNPAEGYKLDKVEVNGIVLTKDNAASAVEKPGFVIGGVPGNFDVSARLGDSPFFVIEADEYDCAFFDKRSKFVHYCPRTLILNNLEFDHADIFDDLKAIQKQFHHLVRIVPGKGKIILPENDINLKQVMAMGCWSEQELVGEQGHWQAKKLNADASQWEVLLDGEKVGEVKWALVGEHNMHNGLMAIAAARHVGVLPADAANALGSFINARRRLELRGEANGVTVYDDFAHHPTAILATLQALRGKVGGTARILAVLEPRSNTMKMGVCKDDLAPSLGRADEVFLLQPQHIPWQVAEVAEACVQPAHWSADVDTLAEMVVKTAHPGDHILVMSNGGFGGIHQKLLDKLAQKAAAAE